MSGCSIADCPNQHVARGFCRKHYDAYMSHGEIPLMRDLMSKRIRSDSLELTGLSPSQEVNLCSLVRALPVRKP